MAVMMPVGNRQAPVSFEAAVLRRVESATLAPRGKAWAACVDVRMIHAFVRGQLLQDPSWDYERGGIPISQLQIGSGPLFVGTRVVHGMRLLGARISRAEEEGLCMLWRLVTHLLGVDAALIGTTHHEQEAFDQKLMRIGFDPDAKSAEFVKR